MLHSTATGQDLNECIELAKDPKEHRAAEEAFATIKGALDDAPSETLEVVERLWNELLTARRSAAFWEQISDVERAMTERLATDHYQLKQNYLRLLQEQ
ncbi:MAG: hypothetical protein AAFX78_13960 [Cyanobacteria bacterium J06638_20]